MGRVWQAGPHFNTATADVEFTTVSGTVALSTAVTRVGPYTIRTNPTATNAFVRQVIYATDQSTHAYFRVYAKFVLLPTSDTTVLRIADAANNPCSQLRFIASTSTLVLVTAAGTQVGSPTAALQTGVWYRLELDLDASSSPGTIAGRLNGTLFASGANSSQTPWSRVVAGPVSSTTTDIHWCDLAVNDTTGSTQTSWPDDGVVIALFPDSAGDANGWSNTANGAGDSSNWQLVDENPPNDTTDLVQTGTLNAEDMYNLAASGMGASDTVNVVMVGARFRNNTADAVAAFKVQARKAAGGTTAQSAAIIANSTTFRTNAPAAPRNYPIIAHTDPDGAAWTPATVNAMQAGVKFTAAGTNRVQVTSVWASVDYTPTGSTPVSVADAATGTDAAATAAVAPLSDTGTGADTATAAATANVADLAAAFDALTVSVAVPLADTAGAADQQTTAMAVALTDTGTAADQADAAAAVALADSGAAGDAVTAAAAGTLTDLAAAADTITAAVAALLGDVAAAVDLVDLGNPVLLGDTATGADGLTTARGIPLGDTVSCADALATVAGTPLGEDAAADDALTVLSALVLVDVAAAAEAFTIPPTSVPGVLAVTARPAGAYQATAAPNGRLEVTAT